MLMGCSGNLLGSQDSVMDCMTLRATVRRAKTPHPFFFVEPLSSPLPQGERAQQRAPPSWLQARSPHERSDMRGSTLSMAGWRCNQPFPDSNVPSSHPVGEIVEKIRDAGLRRHEAGISDRAGTDTRRQNGEAGPATKAPRHSAHWPNAPGHRKAPGSPMCLDASSVQRVVRNRNLQQAG